MPFAASRVLAGAAACAIASSGCSLLVAKRPPSEVVAPNYPVDCTSGRTAPVLDTACAVLAGTMVAAVALNEDAEARRATTLYLGPVVVGCGLSAFVGYRSTARCRALKPVNARCIGGDLGACHELAPGWIPTERWRALHPAASAPATAAPVAPR
ncbi:MAG TPA: hypothetical protein VFL83_22735 [Anaeromyxobacter sp.]|nr:hypothetical protein [Anaeromyxobacter sp.]